MTCLCPCQFVQEFLVRARVADLLPTASPSLAWRRGCGGGHGALDTTWSWLQRGLTLQGTFAMATGREPVGDHRLESPRGTWEWTLSGLLGDAQSNCWSLWGGSWRNVRFRISARKAQGKGASLRCSSPLELMAYGKPAGDLQVSANLNTIRIWQRRLDAGLQKVLRWPPDDWAWNTAFAKLAVKGRGRGPIRHLPLGSSWMDTPGCKLEVEVKWNSARVDPFC
eukprot:5640165-Amphidinium_carterae.5